MNAPIHIQSTPHDFGASSLHAKVLHFAISSQATRRDHVTSFAEHEPTEEQYYEEDHEGDHNDGDNVGDEDDHDARMRTMRRTVR